MSFFECLQNQLSLRACNGFHNLLRNCYGYIRVDDPAPLSHATKPPISIDFRPDGSRFRVHMQDLPIRDQKEPPPLGSSPFLGLYFDSPLTPKFAGKLLDGFYISKAQFHMQRTGSRIKSTFTLETSLWGYEQCKPKGQHGAHISVPSCTQLKSS